MPQIMLHVQNILHPSFYFTAVVIIAAASGLVLQSLCSLTGTLAGGPGSLSPILKHLVLSESQDRAVITRIRQILRWREKCLLCSCRSILVSSRLAFSLFSEVWHLFHNSSILFFSFILQCVTDFLNAGPVGRNKDGEFFLFISCVVNGSDINTLMWDKAIKHESLSLHT